MRRTQVAFLWAAFLCQRASAGCDVQGYKNSVTSSCNDINKKCIAELTASGSGVVRRDVLCSTTNACADFFTCVEKRMSSFGCTHMMGGQVQQMRSSCEVAKALTQKCFDSHSEQCVNSTTTTGFSWKTECSNLDEAELASAQPSGFPITVGPSLNRWKTSALPQSATNQLLTLWQITDPPICSAVVVARSYDGHVWEGLMPTPLEHIYCEEAEATGFGTHSQKCSFAPPDRTNASYRVDATVGLTLGTRHGISRLLRQATFGPTLATIDGFEAEYGGESVCHTIQYISIVYSTSYSTTLFAKEQFA